MLYFELERRASGSKLDGWAEIQRHSWENLDHPACLGRCLDRLTTRLHLNSGAAESGVSDTGL